jgi:protein-tyrosine phosphatase
VALARAARAAGTTRLAATPHVDRVYGVAPLAIAVALERTRGIMRAEGVDIELLAGAEIALDRLVDLRPPDREHLGLGGGPCLLVECPLSLAPGEFEWPIRSLLAEGVPVLLAHPERSPGFQREPQRLRALVDSGAMVQVTTGSVRGDFGTPAHRLTLELAREGLVHNVASDAHGADARPPGLEAAATLAEWLPAGRRELDWILHDAAEAIVAGEPLPSRPAP